MGITAFLKLLFVWMTLFELATATVLTHSHGSGEKWSNEIGPYIKQYYQRGLDVNRNPWEKIIEIFLRQVKKYCRWSREVSSKRTRSFDVCQTDKNVQQTFPDAKDFFWVSKQERRELRWFYHLVPQNAQKVIKSSLMKMINVRLMTANYVKYFLWLLPQYYFWTSNPSISENISNVADVTDPVLTAINMFQDHPSIKSISEKM